MPSIEQRLEALEATARKEAELDTARSNNDAAHTAMLRAVYTVVEELAQEAGIEQAHFLKLFEDRFHFWHEHYTHVGKSESLGLDAPATAISYTRLFDSTDENPKV